MRVIDNPLELNKSNSSYNGNLPKEDVLNQSTSSILVDIKSLPSKGLPYPEGSTIRYIPFTYGQLQKYSSSKMTDRQMNEFALEGIYTEGFNKLKLSYYDFLMLAQYRKLASFSASQFKYNFYCRECNALNNHVATLNTIEFSDLDVPALPIIIPVDDKIELHLGVLTIDNYLRLKEKSDSDEVEIYARSILNMPYDQAYKIISNATDELLELLQEADQMLAFGSQTVDCTCSSCGHVSKFDLGDVMHLVQPFRRPTESIRHKLRFGVSQNN